MELSLSVHTSLSGWQSALCDLSNRFEVSLFGAAGRMRAPRDWAIQDMILPSHLFYSVVEGSFEAKVDGVNRILNPGDTLWAQPDVPLWFRLAQTNLVVLRFRLNACRENGKTIPAPHPIQIFPSTAGTQFLMERLVETADTSVRGTDNLATRAYLLALCTEFERARLPAPPSGNLTPAQCEAVRRCLAKASGDWPTPGDLAKSAELSPPYFTRLFTRTFGRSPRRYLLEQRMQLAGSRLLESSASVSQIARELGYADVFAFSRQFKAVQGQSPSAYRATHSLRSLL